MEDHRAMAYDPLLPGFRFFPSEEELLSHYLSGKNANPGGDHLIGELELYGYDPFELPESACFPYGSGGRKRHWFCFTTVGASKKSREKRRAKNGYWMKKGRTTVVVGPGGNDMLGTRTTFVFYLGKSTKNAVRTNWVLYEYAPVNDHQASFVLCRVFFKTRSGISVSGNGVSSSAEASVSAVRHIGIQHDGSITADTDVDGQIVTAQVPFTFIGCTNFNVFIELHAQGTSSLDNNRADNTNAYTAEDEQSFADDDYLEVNDLMGIVEDN